MSEACAQRHHRPILGCIAGWGASNDATHMTAPDRTGKGLVRAIHQALEVADLSHGDIHAINAHGTGTIYNDQMELTAFAAVFGDQPLDVFSVKGAIGHTLGAAGGIETVIGLKSLCQGIVPPTVGFEVPEKGASKWVSASGRPVSGQYLLSTNSGFGGVNGVLIIGRVP
jgi:3-oxoacyl-[acyl-carrier-protein] synthase II